MLREVEDHSCHLPIDAQTPLGRSLASIQYK